MEKRLNKFEETKLLASRALELSKGAKPKVNLKEEELKKLSYYEIAKLELEEGVLDLEIFRK